MTPSLRELWRRQNDLNVAPVDAVAAAVHVAKPEVEGAVAVHQLHVHLAPQEGRWAFVGKLFHEDDFAVPQQFEFHDGRGHIGTRDQDVLPDGDADRRQIVWGGGEQGLFHF